jgi:hypothetical protein
MILAVMGDELMLPRMRSTDEDRAKIAGSRLHNV